MQLKLDKILQKGAGTRTLKELAFLADHFQYTRFFKELKMKQYELKEVV